MGFASWFHSQRKERGEIIIQTKMDNVMDGKTIITYHNLISKNWNAFASGTVDSPLCEQ